MIKSFAVDRPLPLPTIGRAIAIGTVAVGLLDATDGVAYFWLTAKMNPIVVLQYIASGVFGTHSFHGGLYTASAGLVLHFFISFVAVAVYAALYIRIGLIHDRPLVSGIVYGCGVWTFMNLVVLPLSNAPASDFTLLFVTHGLVGHALFVGLPAALAAERYLVPVEAPVRRGTVPST